MSPTPAPDERPRRIDAGAALLVFLAALLLLTYPLAVREALRAANPWVAAIPCVVLLALPTFALPRKLWVWGWIAIAAATAVAIQTDRVSALSKWPLVLINVALAWRFGATLARGREPLITRFARAERGGLEPDLAQYTRTLTIAWVGLFVLMALVAAALGASPAQGAWAWWSSVGNWLCAAALFIGERWYRRWRFPHYRHGSLWRQVSSVTSNWRA